MQTGPNTIVLDSNTITSFERALQAQRNGAYYVLVGCTIWKLRTFVKLDTFFHMGHP